MPHGDGTTASVVPTPPSPADAVTAEDVRWLLAFFLKTQDALHKRNEAEIQRVMAKCEALFCKDYHIGKVPNHRGELCGTYPPELFIIERDRRHDNKDNTATAAPPAFALDTDDRYISDQISNTDESKSADNKQTPELHTTGSLDVISGEPPASTESKLDEDGALKVNDTAALSEYFEVCRFSRVRSRFIVPVLVVRNRNICRSSTLSLEAEVFLNMAHAHAKNLIFGGEYTRTPNPFDAIDAVTATKVPITPSLPSNSTAPSRTVGTVTESLPAPLAPPTTAPLVTTSPAGLVPPTVEAKGEKSNVDRLRSNDIALLHRLGVKYICDLMVENRKIKYGLTVCSSEKADSLSRYTSAGLEIVSIPYPGMRNFMGRQLRYDWTLPIVNAQLRIPDELALDGISWSDYKAWDLVSMTQNYLRLILRCLEVRDQSPLDTSHPEQPPSPSPRNSGPGVLVHCISGWDRTPLFISLVRISTWADDESHWSLSPAQMLFLTIGYDWVLFSHMLGDRMQRGEEIFQFCFYVIRFIESAEFSLQDEEKEEDSTQFPPPSSDLTNSRADEYVSPILQRADKVTGTPKEAGLPIPRPLFGAFDETIPEFNRHGRPDLLDATPSDTSALADAFSPLMGSATATELFAMDMTLGDGVTESPQPRAPMPSLASMHMLQDDSILGTATATKTTNRHSDTIDAADLGESMVKLGEEDINDAKSRTNERSGWIFGGTWQQWIAGATSTPPKPTHQVSRGFIISESDAPSPVVSTVVQPESSRLPGNSMGMVSSPSARPKRRVDPSTRTKATEQELSEQLTEELGSELDPDAPQNSWQVINPLGTSPSPPQGTGGPRRPRSSSRSVWDIQSTGVASISNSGDELANDKIVTTQPLSVQSPPKVSAITSLLWREPLLTSIVPVGDDNFAAPTAVATKSNSVPATPSRTLMDDAYMTGPVPVVPITLTRVASFTLIDSNLMHSKDEITRLPQPANETPSSSSSTNGILAKAATSLGMTISSCDCCTGVALDPVISSMTLHQIKQQRRRERLRALRTMFMEVYLQVQAELLQPNVPNANGSVWEWFAGGGRFG